MRWQGSVNFPYDLADVVTPNQLNGLNGIFYTCKSNNGIYILNANSVASPIDDVIIQVNQYNSPLSAPGRFIKVNDVFLDSTDVPPEISIAFTRSSSGAIFLRIGGQSIQVGQWPTI